MADQEEPAAHKRHTQDASDGDAAAQATELGSAETEADADADVPEILVEDEHGHERSQSTADQHRDAQEVRAQKRLPVNSHRKVLRDALEDGSELESVETDSIDAAPRGVGSQTGSAFSDQDDSPSVQGSGISSPGSSILPSVASRPGLSSPTPSFRPFDRRFQSRMSSYGSPGSPRPSSPHFLRTHSRNVSLGSNFALDQSEPDTSSAPWEAVRWTKLKKINNQAFSEAARRNFGSPTCLVVSATIVLGTSKGTILVFDYSQNLKLIIGPGTKAVESGAVTSIAVSADHTTIAGGHANGNIFTWDTSRASRPFLTIPHLEEARLQNRTADGHVPNVAITHLGFLGTRHTALVSADDRGMAFSHLATRGTGSLGRSVRTSRILGRYPNVPTPAGKSLKPSTVWAMASLPLGNVEQSTDVMGLTAMLTPYLLVIVSTTPIAQTQHKSSRPKDVQAHGAMTGCLAWFPAVQLKVPDPHSGSNISKTKLVYCWSNVLTVLDVEEEVSEDADRPSSYNFKPRSRWKCEEAIVAVQWLGRSVLTVLTISQRLIVLEDRTMRMTEAFDLLQKHIYHTDLFSTQLQTLVEQLDEDDQSMHGVVADAFYMSFRTYKGRIFLLGFNEVSIGALPNWADRLIAMMEHGDYNSAIQLATTYYTGDADRLTIGLPDDAGLRHRMVHDKIMEIMDASLKYAFGQRHKSTDAVTEDSLRVLAETCFSACLATEEVDYLFDDVYPWFDDADMGGTFLEILESHVLEQSVSIVPPVIVKDLVAHYVSQGWESRLEEMICHMETSTLDLDQVTLLCKQHSLYDALIYVWNQAMGDYITPMIDLLSLLLPLMANGDYGGASTEDDFFSVNALKIFPYLSYSLTGRVYPNGELLSEEQSEKAKAEIYWFFFCGKTIEWPRGSGREFVTKPNEDSQPALPYLRLVLKFDAPSFLSALNEAFEDSFLNDSDGQENQINAAARMDMPEEQIFGLTINRQFILSVLLDVMNPADFAPEDTIYLDMFIARNLPKFQQYLLLSGSTLNKVLTGLCNYPGDDLAEDAQLSAEYLLSVYHPSDTQALISLLKKAGFYRILKRTYKNEEEYGKLVHTYFEDPFDQDTVFDCLSDCLRPNSGLKTRHLTEVRAAVDAHAVDLLNLDPGKSATALSDEPVEVHFRILELTSDMPEAQYEYLKVLLESPETSSDKRQSLPRELFERYIRLMCHCEPSHVSEYISHVEDVDLRLNELRPTLEETRVVDAAVVLMARDGQVREAMDRLIEHLRNLQSALLAILGGEPSKFGATIEEVLQSLQKYVHVGIWLCQGQTKTTRKKTKVVYKNGISGSEGLSPEENLWLTLIDACVQVTRTLSPELAETFKDISAADSELDPDRLWSLLRSLVQHTFTALLAATSSERSSQQSPQVLSTAGAGVSFLRILRAFLTRAASSSPNLSDLREVLGSIFSAYAYEESILRLSNRLLDRSLYVDVQQSVELRQRGWRPRGSTCEACGKRAWGPGVVGSAVLAAWEDKQTREEARRTEKRAQIQRQSQTSARRSESESKGKGKGVEDSPPPSEDVKTDEDKLMSEEEATDGGGDAAAAPSGPLVVLACRHMYHQSCLDSLQDKKGTDFAISEKDYRCPIDG